MKWILAGLLALTLSPAGLASPIVPGCHWWVNTADSPRQLRVDFCGMIPGHTYEVSVGRVFPVCVPAFQFTWGEDAPWNIVEIGLDMDQPFGMLVLHDLGPVAPLASPVKPPAGLHLYRRPVLPLKPLKPP